MLSFRLIIMGFKGISILTDSNIFKENHSIAVPTAIVQAGLRVVSAKKRCAVYFEDKSDSASTYWGTSNTGHSYFFNLMEQTLLTLQPLFAVSAACANENSGAFDTPGLASDGFQSLENRFAALDIDEPTDTDNASASMSSVEPVYGVGPRTKGDINEEKLFGIFCLFDDLSRLRMFCLSSGSAAYWTKLIL